MAVKRDLTIWIANDGQQFGDQKPALEHDILVAFNRMFEVILERDSMGQTSLDTDELKRIIKQSENLYNDLSNAISILADYNHNMSRISE